MPGAICQSFLNYTVNARLLRVCQLIRCTIHVYGRRNSCVSRELAPLPLQSCFEPEIVKHGRTQAHGKIADGAHCFRI